MIKVLITKMDGTLLETVVVKEVVRPIPGSDRIRGGLTDEVRTARSVADLIEGNFECEEEV